MNPRTSRNSKVRFNFDTHVAETGWYHLWDLWDPSARQKDDYVRQQANSSTPAQFLWNTETPWVSKILIKYQSKLKNNFMLNPGAVHFCPNTHIFCRGPRHLHHLGTIVEVGSPQKSTGAGASFGSNMINLETSSAKLYQLKRWSVAADLIWIGSWPPKLSKILQSATPSWTPVWEG